MNDLERLTAEAYDEGVVTAVIRPAAVVPEDAGHRILMELGARDVRVGGTWWSEPGTWQRYTGPWNGSDGDVGTAEVLGTLQVAYGVPTRYEITIFRATITRVGLAHGLTVEALCDEALGFGGISLATCPRANITPPPAPFRAHGRSAA
jgi:hypothetical protein